MLRTIFHICLLASFLLPPLSSALPAGFFTGNPPPISHHDVPLPETTFSPTATPNAPVATPNGPNANPNIPVANPNAPVTSPNVPTATPIPPTINPNVPAATPNAPIINLNPPTAAPNTPVATPNAPVATPNVPNVPQPPHVRETEPSPINNMTWWCNKTPHPNPCNYYFQKNQNRPPRFRSEFLRMLIKTALDQGIIIHSQTKKFGPNCTNNQKKAAWSDCVKLLANTVSQLNRTLIGLNSSAPNDLKCTDFDAQTWLSTAQTNIDTCRLGSEDLNVSDFVLPAISNKNLSDLIGNCLAVNGALMKQHNHTTGMVLLNIILDFLGFYFFLSCF